MSGPKCSVIDLSEQRRRAREEWLQERRKQLEAERLRKEEERRRVQEKADKFDAEVERMVQELSQPEEEELLAEEEFAENCHREVCRVIDETIEEMGYHIIGERADGQATSKLYQYDGNTAINVTDVNGQFTMEVVALDTVDRPATTAEAGWLAGAMQHFCGDYHALRERLEAKELLFTRDLYHCPPSPEYAKVVNTSSYEMKKRKALAKWIRIMKW